MALEFEWDSRKAAQNDSKHGVTFREAATVFGDPLSLTISDPDHSNDEERFVIVGVSARKRLLIVVHVERDDRIRIVSARLASRAESV